mmetsp:Transcript_47186/g.85195  ORF Transcript_47186/g.85195 Transcript_47186/m.85195 type:complete len:223 (+) Transcript_47186:262-930(+)
MARPESPESFFFASCCIITPLGPSLAPSVPEPDSLVPASCKSFTLFHPPRRLAFWSGPSPVLLALSQQITVPLLSLSRTQKSHFALALQALQHFASRSCSFSPEMSMSETSSPAISWKVDEQDSELAVPTGCMSCKTKDRISFEAFFVFFVCECMLLDFEAFFVFFVSADVCSSAFEAFFVFFVSADVCFFDCSLVRFALYSSLFAAMSLANSSRCKVVSAE